MNKQQRAKLLGQKPRSRRPIIPPGRKPRYGTGVLHVAYASFLYGEVLQDMIHRIMVSLGAPRETLRDTE